MQSIRFVLVAAVLLVSAAHARQFLLTSIARAAMKNAQPANQKMRVTVARWGEDFGLGDQTGGATGGDDDWGFGDDDQAGDAGGDEQTGSQTGGSTGGQPGGQLGGGIGGLTVGLFDAITSFVHNVLVGVFECLNHLLNGIPGGSAVMGGFVQKLVTSAQHGTRQSLHQFKQMPQPQRKAIGGLVMKTVGNFDASLRQQLVKFNGHEAAVRSELQHVKRVLEQPHANGNQLLQQLRKAAPKVSGAVAASYKRATAAFRQQFARLNPATKTGIHKLTNNLKQAQLQMRSVLSKATPQHKKALGPVLNVLKNAHTMSHTLL
ncbi:hypothetical protein M3Y99_01309700 [Aphelenchoides fujianensis]|nr:hypothetical protein M3Y99_01309700 [Aphelenchoides fujianensis]